ncbi:hypothetical protein BMS3Bbin10_02296 [bacterium BMS3Bbin10]|nr:hypothetical protein BMS3Bbin10_02296 [bacterium BMS3Bbin10]
MACKRNKKENLKSPKREVSALKACEFARGYSEPAGADGREIGHFLTRGFHECLGEGRGDHAAALAFALSCAGLGQRETAKPVLYCAHSGERQETGALHAPGAMRQGVDLDRLLCVRAARERDVYWVAEQGLSCPGIAAIVLSLGAWERLYDFTISRRLKLRAERAGIPLFMIRHWRRGGASAAAARWRISALPGAPASFAGSRMPLVSSPRFRLRLERGVFLKPRSWEFEYDASGRFHLASPLAHGPPGQWAKRHGRRAA